MAIAIKAENISKQYRLGYVGSGSLKDDARRWWARMRGKEDPLLTIGETNDRSTKGESDYVWALKDINFKIDQGDTVGILGRNGAGKSTLLKILSKVTAPTTGNIKVKGRIASLLEVGTGFHGELTGRENIYLNGAIMGMRKHEITRKLDEIVDFAGVERYLDTPVKRYSSGMYVRLGFAVAAHLENEILIVDEVLAVGDAEFQKKCLHKMKQVSTDDGRTILFVSHNMQSLRALCKKAIILEHGKKTHEGLIGESIEYYVNNTRSNLVFNNTDEHIQLLNLEIGNGKRITNAIEYGEDVTIKLTFYSEDVLINPYFWVGIKSKFGAMFGANSLIDGNIMGKAHKKFTIMYKFPKLKLLPQEYFIACGARKNDGYTMLMSSSDIGSFNIVSSVQQLGLNGPLAEDMAKDSAPMLHPYEVVFNEEKTIKFDPEKLI